MPASSRSCLHTQAIWDQASSCTRRKPGPTAPASGLTVTLRISSQYSWLYHGGLCHLCPSLTHHQTGPAQWCYRAPMADLPLLVFFGECQSSCTVPGCWALVLLEGVGLYATFIESITCKPVAYWKWFCCAPPYRSSWPPVQPDWTASTTSCYQQRR